MSGKHSLTQSCFRTRVVNDSLFEKPEERDGMLAFGMEAGLNESYAALDKLLAAG